MIFVTVGAQMPFDRLVRAVDAWLSRITQPPPVFAQIGRGGWRPGRMAWAELLDPMEFRDRVASAHLVVGHAGMGTILTALEFRRPLLVMPRRANLRETRNDHQLATAARFHDRGVHVAEDDEALFAKLDSPDCLTPPLDAPTTACPGLLGALRGFLLGRAIGTGAPAQASDIGAQTRGV